MRGVDTAVVERVLAVGVAQAICIVAVEPVMGASVDNHYSDNCSCILVSSHKLPGPVRSGSNTERSH